MCHFAGNLLCFMAVTQACEHNKCLPKYFWNSSVIVIATNFRKVTQGILASESYGNMYMEI